jgi:uncharacterized membrane-anchored protein YitT (DUF2179 family)
MGIDRRYLYVGAAMILAACMFRKLSQIIPQDFGESIPPTAVVEALLYLQTGRHFQLPEADPVPETEPFLGLIYGSLLCGGGIGIVFASGTSTGGADILVRLLKLKYRNVPVGRFCLFIDLTVAVLTGLVFQNMTNTLYTGVTVFLTSKIVDAVIYGFDFSKVALIITSKYEEIAKTVGEKLTRGTTFLYGEGAYSGKQTKVVLTAVKRQQLAELKELVTDIDPDAFIIVQEAHQVLGDGFTRYDKNSLQ